MLWYDLYWWFWYRNMLFGVFLVLVNMLFIIIVFVLVVRVFDMLFEKCMLLLVMYGMLVFFSVFVMFVIVLICGMLIFVMICVV